MQPKSNKSNRGGAREGAGRPRKGAADLAKAIARAQDLTLRLLNELDAVTTHHGELEDLIEVETAGDDDPRRRRAMLQAIELRSRAGVLKQLIAATRAWADLDARTTHAPKAAKAPQGKKAERAAAAREASVGKFAPPPPPGGKLN